MWLCCSNCCRCPVLSSTATYSNCDPEKSSTMCSCLSTFAGNWSTSKEKKHKAPLMGSCSEYRASRDQRIWVWCVVIKRYDISFSCGDYHYLAVTCRGRKKVCKQYIASNERYDHPLQNWLMIKYCRCVEANGMIYGVHLKCTQSVRTG